MSLNREREQDGLPPYGETPAMIWEALATGLCLGALVEVVLVVGAAFAPPVPHFVRFGLVIGAVVIGVVMGLVARQLVSECREMDENHSRALTALDRLLSTASRTAQSLVAMARERDALARKVEVLTLQIAALRTGLRIVRPLYQRLDRECREYRQACLECHTADVSRETTEEAQS